MLRHQKQAELEAFPGQQQQFGMNLMGLLDQKRQGNISESRGFEEEARAKAGEERAAERGREAGLAAPLERNILRERAGSLERSNQPTNRRQTVEGYKTKLVELESTPLEQQTPQHKQSIIDLKRGLKSLESTDPLASGRLKVAQDTLALRVELLEIEKAKIATGELTVSQLSDISRIIQETSTITGLLNLEDDPELERAMEQLKDAAFTLLEEAATATGAEGPTTSPNDPLNLR